MGITLLWLPVEDNTLFAAIILAVLFSLWLTFKCKVSNGNRLKNYSVVGLMSGLGGGLIGLFLLIFKMGLHSHATPDFTFKQFLLIIRLTPLLGVGGFFMGWVFQMKKRLS